jgi:ATP synthase protein I
MKVENDLRILLKKVAIIDLIIGCMLTPIVYLFLKGAALLFVLGLFVSLANFVQNGVFSAISLYKKNQLYCFIGYILRMALFCVAAIIIFKQNEFNLIPFLLGYGAHYISIVLYGLSIKNT